jgi:hypothetical protein
VARPGEWIARSPSSSPYTTRRDSTYDRVSSLAPSPSPVDSFASAQSLPPFPPSLILAQGDQISRSDSTSLLYAEVSGYATDYGRYGPYGRFDRILVVTSVQEVEPGPGCAP